MNKRVIFLILGIFLATSVSAHWEITEDGHLTQLVDGGNPVGELTYKFIIGFIVFAILLAFYLIYLALKVNFGKNNTKINKKRR